MNFVDLFLSSLLKMNGPKNKKREVESTWKYLYKRHSHGMAVGELIIGKKIKTQRGVNNFLTHLVLQNWDFRSLEYTLSFSRV